LATRVTSVEPLPGGGFAIDLATSEGDAADDGNGQADAAAPGQHGAAGRLQADAVVLAVPSGQAARLGAAAGITGASRWDDLGASPIVNVHVVYDRPVTDLPFAAAIDSPVQWVFDKTSQSGLAAGQYLAVSLSAADDYIDVPVAALREQFVPALWQLFPAAAQAAVTDFFVTRERRATFRQIPGSGALRPAAATPVRGLVLAGAWTDTGWPDTMEGAVISGHNGAQELVRQMAVGQIAPAAALRPAGAGSPLGAAASGAAS
jgi:predicted NAD/FAD-dependent oxidoreductase